MSRKRLAGIAAGWIGISVIAAQMILAKTAYRAERVIDGDTFDTAEKQIVRLAGIDAPELSNCGGEEAKQALKKLITDKPLYMKVIYRDNFRRLVSWVYTDEGISVNEKMMEMGMAEIDGSYPETSKAGTAARLARKGIFGDMCVQEVNKANPECTIKGNVVPKKSKIKEFRYPGCGQYTNTMVQLYQGDKWFCSEKEAEKAGFVKGSDCTR